MGAARGVGEATLIELLVVIAVLSVLAAIVIFNVTGVKNKGSARRRVDRHTDPADSGRRILQRYRRVSGQCRRYRDPSDGGRDQRHRTPLG